jgi:cellulose synthase/poly-beta-1,6-N-acetylglucosamine synthase-like glycosyltransferase
MIRTLSIVMPAYNEGPTIHRILDKVRAVDLPHGIQKELIVVNDCSKDKSDSNGKNVGDIRTQVCWDHVSPQKHAVMCRRSRPFGDSRSALRQLVTRTTLQ